MHGTYEANMAMQHCDVLVAVGARFDDRVIGNPKHFGQIARKIVHVDIDPSSISKRVRADVPIVGHVKHVLRDMQQHAAQMAPETKRGDLAPWWAQIASWRETNCLAYETSDSVIKPQSVIQTLHKLTQGQAFVTSDVGQHQMWAAQYYGFEAPRRWINSGGLGTVCPTPWGCKWPTPGWT